MLLELRVYYGSPFQRDTAGHSEEDMAAEREGMVARAGCWLVTL